MNLTESIFPGEIKRVVYILFLTLVCFQGFSQSNNCNAAYVPPKFVYSNAELDSFINDNFIIPLVAQTYGIKASIKTSFIVDSLGAVKDVFVSHVELGYFMLHEDEEGTFDAIRKMFLSEAERVILFTDGLWTPANCNGKSISDTIKKDFEIVPENYKKREKDSKTTYALGANAVGGVFENVTYKTPEKYYNNGVKKLMQKKYDIAAKYFKEAIEYKSDYTDAYYDLGIAELKLNNLKAACAAWSKAADNGDADSKDLIKQFCR